MNSRKFELIIVLLLIILICAGVYFGLKNFAYFNISEINISVSGPVSNVTSDIERIINPLKGMNIFEINVGKLKKQLLVFNGIESVEVKRYYPSTLMISIAYSNPNIKAYCEDEDGNVSYFFVEKGKLSSISDKTWKEFDKLGVVELNPAYAQMILKWGSDSSFISMVTLVEHLASNNLITNIKYDNNYGNDFGRLILMLPSCNAQLYVRELVSVQRLDEALALIVEQSSVNSDFVIFDLYSNTLVKRT